jgi:hypothetical protein
VGSPRRLISLGRGMKRRHVATGRKPPGGSRPGAGRPPGARNSLPLGAVGALKALRHRVPDGAPAPLADLAGEALEVVASVLRGEVYDAQAAQVRLKAAAMAREEVCGPIKQRVEHSFEGATDEQLKARYDALIAEGLSAATGPPEGGDQ